eukprot:CAMPEP_0181296612 /NCGR_PEP_ID=MMETSP1101-20121128/4797_1 /TAXON_ID=46948 /ORGANISM="Rhodomonas abbreviata, Strain Caron Lab Isolate" /LENGTH=70 /DNA_ID=CAMNT_0023401489 /DNA_START=388 /DNA_END=597 /DNA_ORIENTATION=-
MAGVNMVEIDLRTGVTEEQSSSGQVCVLSFQWRYFAPEAQICDNVAGSQHLPQRSRQLPVLHLDVWSALR